MLDDADFREYRDRCIMQLGEWDIAFWGERDPRGSECGINYPYASVFARLLQERFGGGHYGHYAMFCANLDAKMADAYADLFVKAQDVVVD